MAANTYRGISFTDMFDVVKKKLDMPIMFTEFGSDAFNAKNNQEDQKMQAYYDLGNWKEIYQNAAGLGKAEKFYWRFLLFNLVMDGGKKRTNKELRCS